MANVTDPAAIKFSNEKIRVAADTLESVYWTAKRVITEWFATGINTKFPNDSTAVVEDGSDRDGRKIIHGADVHNIITRLQEFVTDYEAASNAKLNTVSRVSVNGQGRV